MPVASEGAPVSPTRSSLPRMLDFLRRRAMLFSECNWRSAADVSGGKGSEPPAITACFFFLLVEVLCFSGAPRASQCRCPGQAGNLRSSLGVVVLHSVFPSFCRQSPSLATGALFVTTSSLDGAREVEKRGCGVGRKENQPV